MESSAQDPNQNRLDESAEDSDLKNHSEIDGTNDNQNRRDPEAKSPEHSLANENSIGLEPQEDKNGNENKTDTNQAEGEDRKSEEAGNDREAERGDPDADEKAVDNEATEKTKDSQKAEEGENGESQQSQETSESQKAEGEEGGKKKRKKRDRKEKKDKKEKRKSSKGKTEEGTPPRKERKKKKSQREAIIDDLAHDIFGSSDEEGAFDFGPVEEEQDKDNDYEDVDVEATSKERLKKLAGKKKRAADDSPRQKKRRRRENDEEQSGGEEQVGEREEKKPKEKHFFDEFLDTLKTGRGRGKKKSEAEQLEQISMIEEFKARMEVAAEDDCKDNKEGKPALHKLKMLGEVLAQLEKKNLQQLFIENHILGTVRKWLEPLPDRSLPNMKIREGLLQAMQKWGAIETEELKDSGIGKVIMFLSKHPNETPMNKNVAKQLIERWSRPIFGISEQYKDNEEVPEEDDSQRSGDSRGRKSLTSSREDKFDLVNELEKKRAIQSKTPVKDSPTYHARIPEKIALDFKIKPKSKIDVENVPKKPKRALENRLLQKKAKSPGGIQRASSVSIQGRKLVH